MGLGRARQKIHRIDLTVHPFTSVLLFLSQPRQDAAKSAVQTRLDAILEAEWAEKQLKMRLRALEAEWEKCSTPEDATSHTSHRLPRGLYLIPNCWQITPEQRKLEEALKIVEEFSNPGSAQHVVFNTPGLRKKILGLATLLNDCQEPRPESGIPARRPYVIITEHLAPQVT